MNREHDPVSVAVSRTLKMGVVLSMTMMTAGLLLAFARGGPLPDAATPLRSLASGLGSADPGALMSLGLLVLLATPAARVVVLAWQFARRREWLFLAVSLIVLSVLAGSILVGRGE